MTDNTDKLISDASMLYNKAIIINKLEHLKIHTMRGKRASVCYPTQMKSPLIQNGGSVCSSWG